MSEWTAEQIKEVATTVAEKAKTDQAFRASLISDPHAAIQAATGQVVPETFKMNFVENNGAHMTIVLPDLKSEADELSEAELAQVAGGKNTDQILGDIGGGIGSFIGGIVSMF